MGIIRDSFVVYRDWAEGISELSPKDRLACYDALVEFGLTGEFPEKISNSVARGMLKSFRRGMKDNIARYNASVENGKKGGRPPKNSQNNNLEKPSETQDNLDITQNNLEKPSETQDNLDITQNNLEKPSHNLNVNDNVYVNDNKLVNNNKNIFENYEILNACARVRERSVEEREPFIERFKTFFVYHPKDKFADAAYEIFDTMIEATEQASTEKGLVFKQKRYNRENLEDVFLRLSINQFEKIITQLVFNEEIRNRPAYILGCLIESAKNRSNDGGD